MLDLKNIVKKSQEGFDSISDPTIVLSLSKYEQFVNEAYEGRLFFELIQNARDAAFQKGIKSNIKIVVKEGKVLFANTGKPFNEKGILAMTRLGLSDKSDNGLIGNKGIGFKSIQEFTKKIKVITEFGTFYFDREELKNKLNEKFPELFDKELSIPLFYYPHFEDIKNNQVEEFKNEYFDTIIDFDLDKNKTEEDIIELYDKITDEELILLGSVNAITFESEKGLKNRNFDYSEDGFILVENNGVPKNFKVFTPINKIEIPDSTYEEFDETDKKLFEKDKSIDIKLVFEFSDKKTILRKENSKLFLYYPLEIISGFPYIIHSNFSCNPERTTIRDTKLNEFLFDHITTMQTTQILDYLVENNFKDKLIDFLFFEKSKEIKLDSFYKMYINKLKEKKFIWINNLNEFVSPDEIVFCPKEIFSFLKNHKFDGKYLYTCEELIKNFLIDNFQVNSLTTTHIFNHIEEICGEELLNPSFFERLYAICIKNDIDVSNKKILLGSNNTLYSKEDDVFYISGKSNVKIPEDINSKLIVLNPSIKIKYEDLNKGIRLLGIKDFRTHDIVEKALSLFDSPEIRNYSIIYFLFGLNDLTPLTKDLIYRNIYLPIQDSKEWLQPIFNPIYFDIANLKELFPDGNFIDIDLFFEYSSNQEKWESFFIEYGVWNIPAMYYSKEKLDTTGDRRRTLKINNKTNKSAYGFEVSNDRKLDFPTKPNYFFYNSIFSYWSLYHEKIINQSVLKYRVKSTIATNPDTILDFVDTTLFVNTLLNNSWIYLSEDQLEPYSVDEIFGLNRLDYTVERNLIKHLKIFALDYHENRTFIESLNIKHFNAFTTKHIISILKGISESYIDKENEILETDFKRFYHVVLKYLYNTFNQTTIEANRLALINHLKNINFLCQQIEEGKELIAWKKPNEIFYVDEKQLFELMPQRFVEVLKYYFTKSDKNEIGKIFSRIGKKLSNEVKQQVDISGSEKEFFFINNIENLSYIIVAVEDKLNEHLSDVAFSKLKELKILYNKGLKKIISLNSNIEYVENVSMNYFFYEEEKSVYILDDLYPVKSDKSIFGEIINDVFNSLVPKELDLSRLFRDLLHSKSSTTFIRALKDIEYDNERILEIDSIFNEQKLTPKQVFWDAILFAKETVDYSNVFKGNDEINFNLLISYLNAVENKIKEWASNLNYIQLSSSTNYEILKEIINSENLSIYQLNEKLENPISFEYLYRQEFNRYKNGNLNKIKILLIDYFNKQPIASKEKFHESLIFIEKLEPQEWVTNKLDFNVENDLIEGLNRKFNGYDLSIDQIVDADESEWEKLKNTIPQRTKKLKESLRKINSEMQNFQDFINKDTSHSLLFFEDYDELIDRYSKLYPKSNDESDTTKTSDIQFEMADEDNKSIIVCDVKGDSLSSNSNAFENELQKLGNKGGSKGNGVSGGSSNLPNQDYLKHIGQEGERLLFLKLTALYKGNVTWASENAVCMGFISDKEAVGYDIRYIDENNETHYVEVKTSTHQEPEFHISINEIRSARKYGEHYHVYWITNLFDAKRREYYDLKNMFVDFEEGQDFFHNNKFYPQLTGFKIIFKSNTIKPVEELIELNITEEVNSIKE